MRNHLSLILQKVSIQINDCHTIFVSEDDKLTSDDFNSSNPESVIKDKKSGEKDIKQLKAIASDADEVMGDISNGPDNFDGDTAKATGTMDIRKVFPIKIVQQSFLSSRFVPDIICSNKILFQWRK